MLENVCSYVKSRSDKQLRSKAYESDTSSCDPEGVTTDGPIVPCGLIAWSLFNDTYGFSVKTKILQVNKNNIAWDSDKEHKFGSDVYPKNFQSGGLIGGAKLNSSIPVSFACCVSLALHNRYLFLPFLLLLAGVFHFSSACYS